jgi:Ca2+-binding RTX toxin-like protein
MRSFDRIALPSPLPQLMGPRPAPGAPGVGLFDLIEGDDGDNSLFGTAGDDMMRGFDGNDFMSGAGGIDTMYGGDGNDSLQGGLDVDTIYGGSGDDAILGTAFGAILSTDGPCDIIQGGSGIDRLMINYDNWINSGTSQPINVIVDISIGSGEVQVDGFRGENFSQMETLHFVGPDGDDIVTGGDLADFIDGQRGDDVIRAKDGDDIVLDSGGFIDANGGNGTDNFQLNLTTSGLTDAVVNCQDGTVAADGSDMGSFVNFELFSIRATTGSDTLYAHDTIGCSLIGWIGDDTIYGGSGNDTIDGDQPGILGGGNDEIHGGDGDDSIRDAAGNNILDGGTGNDSIVTVGVIDTIAGGSGDDHLGWRVNVAQVGGSYDGGTGFDILSLDVPTGTFDITGLDISRYEELAEFIFGGTFYTCILSTDQFSMFESIHMPSGLATLELADNADVVMPDWCIFGTLQLADGGQTVDFRGVGSDDMPLVLGSEGKDTVFGPGEWIEDDVDIEAHLGGGNDRYVGSFDGGDIVDGGDGKDRIEADKGHDDLTGGLGADTLDGGKGFDDFIYNDVAESTGANFDTIRNFDINDDEVIVPFDVVDANDPVVTGALSKATFNDDLKAAIGKNQLDIQHLVIFTPDAGDYAGQTFVIFEANGKKGYQSNADYVIRFDNPNFVEDGINLFT